MTKTITTDEFLTAFLAVDVVPEKNVYIRRFGLNFRIKGLDGKQIARLRDQASFPTRGGGTRVDEEKLSHLLITNACIEPNWSDPQILERFGPTPEDAVQKRLLAGEVAILSAAILNLSGFSDDESAEVDAVKN